MSAAVVVVEDTQPLGIRSRKPEVGAVRLDNFQTRDTICQGQGGRDASAAHEISTFSSGAIRITANELSVVARQRAPGTGHVQQASLTADGIGGPPRWYSAGPPGILTGQAQCRNPQAQQVQSRRFESRLFQSLRHEKAMLGKATEDKALQEMAANIPLREDSSQTTQISPQECVQQFLPNDDNVGTAKKDRNAGAVSFIDLDTSGSRDSVRQFSVKEKVIDKVEKDGNIEAVTVIDLDTYEDAGEPSSDVSMALVVVPKREPEGILNHNTELVIVRADNPETGETTSQCNSVHGGPHDSDGFSTRTSATESSVARRWLPGNSNVVTPGAGDGDGSPRWATTTVGILTVQCARCLKWRVVPSREKYEEIREHILETPWVCENAVEWRPDANCRLPTDLNQDSGSVWAIDRPNLPSSPPGWSRKVVVRRDCSTRFADVYYIAPDGKTLRSSVEVAKYLEGNPKSVPPGTRLNQFSFTSPRPLPGVWVARKRNRTKSLESEEFKKAKTAQPFAQNVLHGTPPPSLPAAPSFTSSRAQPYPLPVGSSFPAPTLGPDLVHFVAMQSAATRPPGLASTSAQNVPLFATSVPLRECPSRPSCVDRFSRPLQQPFSHRQDMTTSNTG